MKIYDQQQQQGTIQYLTSHCCCSLTTDLDLHGRSLMTDRGATALRSSPTPSLQRQRANRQTTRAVASYLLANR
eukprot:COSAG01_NODE_639_length_14598_cov_316.689841_6_plen_74_part_00